MTRCPICHLLETHRRYRISDESLSVTSIAFGQLPFVEGSKGLAKSLCDRHLDLLTVAMVSLRDYFLGQWGNA